MFTDVRLLNAFLLPVGGLFGNLLAFTEEFPHLIALGKHDVVFIRRFLGEILWVLDRPFDGVEIDLALLFLETIGRSQRAAGVGDVHFTRDLLECRNIRQQ